MLVAPSRVSTQLLASRVVLVQSHNWRGHKSIHDGPLPHAYPSLKKNGLRPPIAPLLSSLSIFSPLNLSKFGTRAMASMGRKFAVPERQRIYIASPAQLISPFLPPEKAPSILSRQGISDHWRSVKNFLISLISSQQIRSKLKPLKEKFYSHTFRNTAAKYYEDINKGTQLQQISL
eukprot:Phypoly_transcript_14828.p1 GENE.Phypoly_transcript_14828~~Phypoly_transcript_14828.p1  ORF type:complete len:176 (-),score=11.87 Phypoly_transcript_14828:288-815(-)